MDAALFRSGRGRGTQAVLATSERYVHFANVADGCCAHRRAAAKKHLVCEHVPIIKIVFWDSGGSCLPRGGVRAREGRRWMQQARRHCDRKGGCRTCRARRCDAWAPIGALHRQTPSFVRHGWRRQRRRGNRPGGVRGVVPPAPSRHRGDPLLHAGRRVFAVGGAGRVRAGWGPSSDHRQLPVRRRGWRR